MKSFSRNTLVCVLFFLTACNDGVKKKDRANEEGMRGNQTGEESKKDERSEPIFTVLRNTNLKLRDDGLPSDNVRALVTIGQTAQRVSAQEGVELTRAQLLSVGVAFCGQDLKLCTVQKSDDDLYERFMENR